MTTKVQDKNTQLIAVLLDHFGKNMNLARIKLFGMFICALCKVQTVGFEKLAVSFESESKSDSSLRRIQRFMADYKLNTDLIAQLIFKLLPHKPPFRLAMDRTNWKFGDTNINILTLAIVYQGVGFPILYRMMPKFGTPTQQKELLYWKDISASLVLKPSTVCWQTANSLENNG
ncbi:hypothetical protein MASR1M31_05030 [Porphyromonadaceae bacterium]